MEDRIKTKIIEWRMIETMKIVDYKLNKSDTWYVLDLYWGEWCYHTYYFKSENDLIKYIG